MQSIHGCHWMEIEVHIFNLVFCIFKLSDFNNDHDGAAPLTASIFGQKIMFLFGYIYRQLFSVNVGLN